MCSLCDNGLDMPPAMPDPCAYLSQVVFQASSIDSIKELVQDKIYVQSESGETELPIKALLPRSDVTVTGDLNFGLVPIDSKATKKFQIINRGTAPSTFKLDYDK